MQQLQQLIRLQLSCDSPHILDGSMFCLLRATGTSLRNHVTVECVQCLLTSIAQSVREERKAIEFTAGIPFFGTII